MLPVKILRNSRTFHFFRRVWVQTISTKYDNFGWENFDNLCTCSNNLHYFKVFIVVQSLNFHIEKPHQFTKFWMATISWTIFLFLWSICHKFKKCTVYTKSLWWLFQWNKTFRCFFPTLRETKYKMSKHSLVLHLKNEIDLEKMLND